MGCFTQPPKSRPTTSPARESSQAIAWCPGMLAEKPDPNKLGRPNARNQMVEEAQREHQTLQAKAAVPMFHAKFVR